MNIYTSIRVNIRTLATSVKARVLTQLIIVLIASCMMMILQYFLIQQTLSHDNGSMYNRVTLAPPFHQKKSSKLISSGKKSLGTTVATIQQSSLQTTLKNSNKKSTWVSSGIQAKDEFQGKFSEPKLSEIIYGGKLLSQQLSVGFEKNSMTNPAVVVHKSNHAPSYSSGANTPQFSQSKAQKFFQKKSGINPFQNEMISSQSKTRHLRSDIIKQNFFSSPREFKQIPSSQVSTKKLKINQHSYQKTEGRNAQNRLIRKSDDQIIKQLSNRNQSQKNVFPTKRKESKSSGINIMAEFNHKLRSNQLQQRDHCTLQGTRTKAQTGASSQFKQIALHRNSDQNTRIGGGIFQQRLVLSRQKYMNPQQRVRHNILQKRLSQRAPDAASSSNNQLGQRQQKNTAISILQEISIQNSDMNQKKRASKVAQNIIRDGEVSISGISEEKQSIVSNFLNISQDDPIDIEAQKRKIMQINNQFKPPLHGMSQQSAIHFENKSKILNSTVNLTSNNKLLYGNSNLSNTQKLSLKNNTQIENFDSDEILDNSSNNKSIKSHPFYMKNTLSVDNKQRKANVPQWASNNSHQLKKIFSKSNTNLNPQKNASSQEKTMPISQNPSGYHQKLIDTNQVINIEQKNSQFLNQITANSKMATGTGNLMQNAFAGLRHKLIKKLSNQNKYKQVLKWPTWLLQNPQYRQIAHQHSKKRNMFDICMKSGNGRVTPEKRQLCDYLKRKVLFFSQFPMLQIEKISDKLTSEFFTAGQNIFLQGSMGNKMYIIVSGLVEVLIQGTKVAQIRTNSIFGETAITINAPRGATIRAVLDTQCLILRKEDYDSAIISVKKLQKFENQRFVQDLELIKEWDQTKKQNFTFNIESRKCVKGQVIFEQGDPSKVFYILKSGRLKTQMCLDVQTNNKYPVVIIVLTYYYYKQDNQRWQVVKTTKRVLHFLKDIQRGEHFGHEEILLKGIPRKRRVTAQQDSDILYVKQAVFQKCNMIQLYNLILVVFRDESDIQKLENVDIFDVEKIKYNVLHQMNKKKSAKNAILDATNLNITPITNRDHYQLSSNKKSQHVLHWLSTNGSSNLSNIQSISTLSPQKNINSTHSPSNSFGSNLKSFQIGKLQMKKQSSRNLKKRGDGCNSASSSIRPLQNYGSGSPQKKCLNKTLKTVHEKKAINSYSEFLDMQGELGKAGDFNIRIVDSMKDFMIGE